MSCDEALEAISAALDGELSPGERAKLSEHLLQCEHCRRIAEDFRVLTELLEDSEVPAPEGLAASVCAAAAREAQEAPVPHRRRPYLSAVAALALCIGLGGVSLFVFGQGQKEQNLAAGTAMYQAGSAAGEPYNYDAADENIDGDNGSCPEAPMEKSMSNGAGEPLPAPRNTFDVSGDACVESAEGSGPSADLRTDGLLPGAPAPLSFRNEQVIRVTWGATPSAPSARILGSTQSLADFTARFPEDDLTRLPESYDGDYFSTGRLLAVVVEAGSGSVSHSIAAQGLHRDQVEIVRAVPEVGTDDMAAWLLLAEVDTPFEDGDTLSVVFTDVGS